MLINTWLYKLSNRDNFESWKYDVSTSIYIKISLVSRNLLKQKGNKHEVFLFL